MKIIYENELENYTSLTSDNPDVSYPLTNVLDEFLYRRYQSTSTTDSIDITLENAVDIDCIAISYHNLSSLVMRVYNLADTLVHTETISSPRSGEMKYFTSVSAKRLEIDLVSSGNCYLGGISVGECLQMPYMSITPAFSHRINSYTRQTAGGQSTGQKRSILKAHNAEFQSIEQSQFDAIIELLESVQNVDKFYMDIYPGSTYMTPYYSRVESDEIILQQDGTHGVLYSGAIGFVECK